MLSFKFLIFSCFDFFVVVLGVGDSAFSAFCMGIVLIEIAIYDLPKKEEGCLKIVVVI